MRETATPPRRGPFTRTIQSVPITARQWEYMQLIAEGWDDKSLAERCGVSWHTARAQVRELMRKFGFHSDKGKNPRVQLASLVWQVQQEDAS